jgi:hypothetical protein
MATRLSPCPSCARHVKVGSASCPFCGADVPVDVPTRVQVAGLGKPLTRALIMFAGAAAVSGCSSSSTTVAAVESAKSTSETTQVQASYGAMVVVYSETSYSTPETSTSTVGQPQGSYGTFTEAPSSSSGDDAGSSSEHTSTSSAYGSFSNGASTQSSSGPIGSTDGGADSG